MAFLDDVFESAKTAGKFICDKAEDAKDYVTLEYKAASIKSKLNEAYKELGRLVYESSVCNEECGKTKECIEKISALCSELDNVQDMMAKFKNICPVCKAANTNGANFCTKCGAKL